MKPKGAFVYIHTDDLHGRLGLPADVRITRFHPESNHDGILLRLEGKGLPDNCVRSEGPGGAMPEIGLLMYSRGVSEFEARADRVAKTAVAAAIATGDKVIDSYERVCDVCDHSQEVDVFEDFRCNQCGQKYERASYKEGHRIVLSPEQCRLLREGLPRCKTCKWWKGPVEPSHPGGLGKCHNPKMVDRTFLYRLYEGEGPKDVTMGLEFGGCVHHEEKA